MTASDLATDALLLAAECSVASSCCRNRAITASGPSRRSAKASAGAKVAAALVGDDVAVEAVLAAAAAGDDDDDASVGVGGRTAVAVAGFVAAPMGDADRYVVVALEAPAAEIAMGGGEKDRLRGDRWDDGCRV
jgi:hypothetical protein